MSLQILGGILKGHGPKSPSKGIEVRPTSVLLRRRFFDSNQHWSDQTFIDLCAGSGAMGMEAWSRGATEVHLVENNRKLIIGLKQYLEQIKTKFTSEFEVRPCHAIQDDIIHWLDTFGKKYLSNPSVTLFFDPPYEDHELYRKFVANILSVPKMEASVWVESCKQKGLPMQEWEKLGLQIGKIFEQGTSYIVRITRP